MASELTVRLSTVLEARINAIKPTLSDKELGVAQFLLSAPKEFVSLSISALASRCAVSETVIIRLYRKLGYEGFHQFKIDIAQSLTEAAEDRMVDLSASDSMEAIKRKVFSMTRQTLEDAIQLVDDAALVAASNALLSANRVVVIAFGGSASVGLDFVHKLLKLGIMAQLWTDSHMQIMSASVLGPGDLLLAVSHSGNSRDIVEALEVARGKGATTLVVTGFPKSPATRASDISLITPCRETEYQTDAMTSRIVQLAVFDTLYVSMIFANKERATATIHETSLAAAKKKL